MNLTLYGIKSRKNNCRFYENFTEKPLATNMFMSKKSESEEIKAWPLYRFTKDP